MALTELDAVPALVVIDLQKGIAGFPLAHPFQDIVDRSARLADAFRARNLPVVLVTVAGRAPGRTDAGPFKFTFPPDWSELVPGLEPKAGDHTVTKERVGAFLGTDLDSILRGHGVTQVFLTGVATTAGVESTGRGAYDLGYHVVYVVDAMTDRDAEAHRYGIEKVFPRFGETATTNAVLERLQAR